MDGELHKIANGHYSYDIANADQNDLYKIADILAKQFNFETPSKPIIGLDGVYWNFEKDNIKLTLGWDNWTGVFIMAHCENGDAYIAEIGKYIDDSGTI